jgi:hypothetical protein
VDFFVQIHTGQPSSPHHPDLLARAARLDGALGGMGSIGSVGVDPAGRQELIVSLVPASAWVGAWSILRTELNQLGVMDDAMVSLFLVADDTDEAVEDRVLWVGRNVNDDA